ncbi:MAG: hypothetical protein ABIU63_07755 [Chitinophagaceae bacterium]
MKLFRILSLPAILIIVLCPPPAAQAFIHPGIDQQAKDLMLMKKKVLAGEQPWKTAFDKLKAATDTSFIVKAHMHEQLYWTNKLPERLLG